jgi:hypothetical protein
MGGPIVLGEDERGEVNLAGELDEPLQRGGAGVERRGPRLDVGHLLETAGQ